MNMKTNWLQKCITILMKIGKDKVLHSYISLIIFGVLFSHTNSYIASFLITLVIGIVKEVVDFANYGWKDQHLDILADISGMIIFIILNLIQ